MELPARVPYRLDATANDEAGTAHGGAMSAGEKSIKQALEAVEENGTEREVRAAFGPNADAFAPQAAPEFSW